jgi:hypothetical protein
MNTTDALHYPNITASIQSHSRLTNPTADLLGYIKAAAAAGFAGSTHSPLLLLQYHTEMVNGNFQIILLVISIVQSQKYGCWHNIC